MPDSAALLPLLPLDEPVFRHLENKLSKMKDPKDAPAVKEFIGEIIFRLEHDLDPANDRIRKSWERVEQDLNDLNIPLPTDHVGTAYGLLNDYRAYLIQFLEEYLERLKGPQKA